MILIVSQHAGEHSTEEVIDWLDHKKADYFRLNGNDLIEHCNFKIDVANNKATLSFPEREIELSKVKAFWYRRWLSGAYHYSKYEELMDTPFNKMRFSQKLNSELLKIKEYLRSSQKDKPWLSNMEKVKVNKLDVLQKAKKYGITIPETIITNSKEEVIKFKNEHGSIIVKAISEAMMLSKNGTSYSAYTAILTDEIIESLPDKFYASLLQNTVEKEYELRIFYLEGDFYGMAIFSQNDNQTSVDFRQYNHQKPNRRVPFKLPKSIEDKLTLLMKDLDLNTGSIDLIKTKSGDYVFLEINPVGQFGMTSGPCNYYLEEKVADFLIKKSA
ncbi:grasp-with-spasm system ATP-grasp peptide maturase [Aquimarina macrocephali]|uniref:grasp-with-spasm system ATP-grasp peptide maturase n=1 Tax=Aquimarina macrocephali TaxID=666563 RepID=UPI003F66BF83